MEDLWLLTLNLYGVSVCITIWVNVFGQWIEETKNKSNKKDTREAVLIALAMTLIPVVNIIYAIKNIRFLNNLSK